MPGGFLLCERRFVGADGPLHGRLLVRVGFVGRHAEWLCGRNLLPERFGRRHDVSARLSVRDGQHDCAHNMSGRVFLRHDGPHGLYGRVHQWLVLLGRLDNALADRVSAGLLLCVARHGHGAVPDRIGLRAARYVGVRALYRRVVLRDAGPERADRSMRRWLLLRAGSVDRHADGVRCGQFLPDRFGGARAVHAGVVLRDQHAGRAHWHVFSREILQWRIVRHPCVYGRILLPWRHGSHRVSAGVCFRRRLSVDEQRLVLVGLYFGLAWFRSSLILILCFGFGLF